MDVIETPPTNPALSFKKLYLLTWEFREIEVEKYSELEVGGKIFRTGSRVTSLCLDKIES